eukprot:1156649-Pelagomonas_calceolata.AAC.7
MVYAMLLMWSTIKCCQPCVTHTHAAARISAMVNAMLLLRSTLKVLPALRDSLEGAESLLLRAVHRTCQEGALAEVLEKIDEVGV